LDEAIFPEGVGTFSANNPLCHLKGGIMKSASIIFGIVLAILVSVKANAVVHEPGHFIPSKCGAQNLAEAAYLVDIDQLCFGKMVISEDQKTIPAVQFKLTSGQEVNLRIVTAQAISGVPSIPGISRFTLVLQNEKGDLMEMKIVRSADGKIRIATGKFDVIKFQVQDFEEVYSATSIIDSFENSVPEYHNLPDNDFRL
jgi:hypothetical protein